MLNMSIVAYVTITGCEESLEGALEAESSSTSAETQIINYTAHTWSQCCCSNAVIGRSS